MKSWLDSQINLAKTTHQRRQKALVSFHVPHLHSLVCIQRGCRCKRSFSAIEWITMDQSLQHHCKMQDGPVGFRSLKRYGGFFLGPSRLSGVRTWSLVSLREHCFTQGHMSRRSSVQCLFYILGNVCNLFTLVTNRPVLSAMPLFYPHLAVLPLSSVFRTHRTVQIKNLTRSKWNQRDLLCLFLPQHC